MKTNSILLATAAVAAITACSSRTTRPAENSEPLAVVKAPVIGGDTKTVGMLPKATVYRMAGAATTANVPVLVNSAGNIVSFPAPGDVVGQEPIALADGWLLDRRGIGPGSRFTRWTYAEYASLPTAPSLSEIKDAIIPGARPVDIHILDMTPSEAAADTAAVNLMIKKF